MSWPFYWVIRNDVATARNVPCEQRLSRVLGLTKNTFFVSIPVVSCCCFHCLVREEETGMRSIHFCRDREVSRFTVPQTCYQPRFPHTGLPRCEDVVTGPQSQIVVLLSAPHQGAFQWNLWPKIFQQANSRTILFKCKQWIYTLFLFKNPFL